MSYGNDDFTIKKISELNDPNRCQANHTSGKSQCTNVAGNGSQYCIAHGGNGGMQAHQKENLRNYQLTRFHAELERHAESSHIKSLKDEIGILRMTLENVLNDCKDTSELLLSVNRTSTLVMQIASVVEKCDKIDKSIGNMLDRVQVSTFSSSIVQIIAENVTDDAVLDNISDQILHLLTGNGKVDTQIMETATLQPLIPESMIHESANPDFV